MATDSDTRSVLDPVERLSELLFGITHEGAADVEDLLDRRTRVGLVPADRELAVPAAQRALRIASGAPG